MDESTLRLDDLQYKGLKIFQKTDLYTFTSDAVLLANFVKIAKNANALEIGSGSGVVSFLVAAKTGANVKGIELQNALYELSQKSREFNTLTNPEFYWMRAQEAEKAFGANRFDAVFVNPPYFKSAPNMQSENESVRLAKHECELTMEEIAKISSRLLKSGGDFFAVIKAQRLCECVALLSLNKLEAKEIVLIVPKSGSAEADTALIRARKCAGRGARVRVVTLLDEGGAFTKEAEKLMGKEGNE